MFCAFFPSVAAPRFHLLKKSLPERICWTAKKEPTFNRLKTQLNSSPVLLYPDFSWPIMVKTDASDTGLGQSFLRISRVKNTLSVCK